MTILCILQWLTDRFLPYLDEWEQSVSERKGYTKAEQSMMLLSSETRLGLRITGTCTYVYVHVCPQTIQYHVHVCIILCVCVECLYNSW